jgi:hypothetical protein
MVKEMISGLVGWFVGLVLALLIVHGITSLFELSRDSKMLVGLIVGFGISLLGYAVGATIGGLKND